MPSSKWSPNPAQRQAVDHGRGPLRILAGAGSGKTTTLVQRIIALVERGLCRPEQILMLTFTTKGVADIRAKVARALGENGAQPRIETYHAYAWSLVQEFADRLGLQPDPVLLTEGQLRLLARQQIDRLGLATFDLTRTDEAVKALLEFADWMRHEGALTRERADLLGALPPDADTERLEDLLDACASFQTLLREKNAVDYGAQIALAVALLEGHADVRAEVTGRHPFLLVDEYQDTDHLQGRLIRLLAGAEANITVVGDPDQTIHGFRGATMTNIEAFHQEWPGVLPVAMVTNYRSTPEIVALANAAITGNTRRKEDFLVADRASGPRPVLAEAPDWPAEARWIAAQIAALHASGIGYREMAILVRKNRHKLPLLAALTEAGIPVEVVGGLGLFDDPETRRFIGYLGALAAPGDDGAVSVALSMPRYGLSDREIAALARARGRGQTLLDLAAASSDARLVAFCREFWPLYAAQFSEGCLAAVRAALALHGPAMGAQSGANAEQLLPLAEGLFAHPHLYESEATGLALFVEYISELRGVGESPEAVAVDLEREAVKLMTVHAVKGLEFPVVFVPRLTHRDFAPDGGRWEKAFPLEWHHDASYRENASAMLAEEERRLFYVAVTRAQDRLFLSWAASDPDRVKPLAPSPFVAEVAVCCDPVAVEAAQSVLVDEVDVAAVVGELVSNTPAASVEVGSAVGSGELAVPMVLSFSHLHTYQLCPYRFYLQYVLRAPGRPNRAADEGVRVHVLIEQHGGVGVFEPDAAERLDEVVFVDGDSAGLMDPLKAYAGSEYANSPALASEAEFHLRLGGAVVRGFIDRVHRRPSDGAVEVVDFKTYNRLMTAHEVKAGLQLPLYILGARQAMGYPEVSTGALFFLKHGSVVRVSYTEAELADRAAEAARLVEAIRAGRFGPAPGAVCGYCPYRDGCPVAI